ncbi:NAD(P)H-dependent glycerol-3-phosphate dehydrogenase [Candidatus Macondimonas diazotrophica]|jgi:glycerol-3-phosphate dehydrogenase (NAD(P)+)|uniref:Glycerol-3-phosphate dehydrogenase [NAD(P)+] n=1 Tax=Candidatus Macondimonas diazotrophica TaxID=2305248 RepID=A0A4Z0FF81_9GAMM|nr:NAD(P)H-dependent glycerol-3-phosphate dehydrogenase [Candidatus Macondimonas diazotrophica]NCU00504.1 NAD(P)-dependent glycerol-3-phosphate dehydrogenase [Candidatus Macondimonas diazotrophica]TFZ84091.1 NAD(P)-dependent glycerol-3-phosphate dehydrogenase [Candidatus Macondimonas diazotrophica]HBG29919.1 glycerol-3-phosphate dehydrogenase [Gammaproteobacteria bacterium]
MTETRAPQAIVVLGAGSWGTALAIHLARQGHPVTLWAHRPEHATTLATARRNTRYLPDAEFPDGLSVQGDLAAAVYDRDLLLVAVPSHALRDVLRRLQPLIGTETRLIWATKGLEQGSCHLPHQVVEETLGARSMAALSGPTFAREVAAGLPAAVAVASRDQHFAREVAELFHDGRFRAYTSPDLVGVEIGGAVKNVLAIATGAADGLRFGANSRAALITRGLAEIMRLGLALGGQASTFMGLAGLGDLVLTCTDDQSRNRRMGLALARGLSSSQAQQEIGQVVEGVQAASAVWTMAQREGVRMPITEQVYRILYEGLSPHEAVEILTQGPAKPEFL